MKLLDKVLSHFQNQLPFVVYAKPNETILHGIFQNDAILNVFENQSGFVFSSFYNGTNVVFPLFDSEVFQEEINLEIDENPIQIDTKSDENARILFENLVRNGVSEIEKGTFEKVVLSRKIEVSQSVDFIKSYQNL